MRTLVLDSSFYPVTIVSWQKAMILFLSGRAQVVDVYKEINIRSPQKQFQLPRVLRLFSKHMGSKETRFTRFNVFYRDDFSCQYCFKKMSMHELTFDHVLPLSRGGTTCWENIVTCCPTCNTKKGNKTLEESHFKLRTKPYRPRWTPEMCFRLKKEDPEEWHMWIPFSQKSRAT